MRVTGYTLLLLRLSSRHRFPYSFSSSTPFSSLSALYHTHQLGMDSRNTGDYPSSSLDGKPFSSYAVSRRRGRDFGRGGAADGEIDRIDALGRLMTRILRHKASELNLKIRSDGYAGVGDLLKLNLTTYAKVPLSSHTIEDIKEAVRRDNKQRFGLLEENGKLLIRANQGHSLKTVTSEDLLKPIQSSDEVQVCVHGSYKRNLKSILQHGLKRMERLHVHFASGLPSDGEVISGLRKDVNILIFLDIRKALQDGMKFYISDNCVILTEGFDGTVPAKYFDKIETWPGRETLLFKQTLDS